MQKFIHRSNHKGFTLIELLIVIAIIAILAAILFPVFGRARENARRASCQSNLKQIGLGLLQYTQDYDEVMPFHSYGYVNASNNPGDWMDTIQPYVKSYQVLRCPSDSNTALPAFTNQVSSYAVNMVGNQEVGPPYVGPFTHYSGNTGNPLVRVSQAMLPVPVTTIVMADNDDNTAFMNVQNWADLNQSYNKINSSVTPRTLGGAKWSERHLDTINTLFADGHVKAVKLEFFVEPTTSGTKATHLTIAADPE